MKMKTILLTLLMASATVGLAAQNATKILETVDNNMSSENRIFESDMVIHGRRSSRTITSISYSNIRAYATSIGHGF